MNAEEVLTAFDRRRCSVVRSCCVGRYATKEVSASLFPRRAWTYNPATSNGKFVQSDHALGSTALAGKAKPEVRLKAEVIRGSQCEGRIVSDVGQLQQQEQNA